MYKNKNKTISGRRLGGQEIIVFTYDNMVNVFTGRNYVVRKHIHKILKRFVLPAIK